MKRNGRKTRSIFEDIHSPEVVEIVTKRLVVEMVESKDRETVTPGRDPEKTLSIATRRSWDRF